VYTKSASDVSKKAIMAANSHGDEALVSFSPIAGGQKAAASGNSPRG